MRLIALLLLTVFLSMGRLAQEYNPESVSTNIIEADLFDEAVDCIKKFEGWHSAEHYPYVGYGHRLMSGEKYTSDISESVGDSILRVDLRQKCSVFRRFGKDSLLLGVLAYNVGEYTLLGWGQKPKSSLIIKLENGNRNIYNDYTSYCRYKGEAHSGLKNRREYEYDLLFVKNKDSIENKI